MIEIFGDRLRELREEKNMDQIDLAEEVGIGNTVLSNYELSKREPDFENLVILCDYFQVTADYLLGRTDKPGAYREMSLDKRLRELLLTVQQLPEARREDVLRYAKFILTEEERK